MLCRSRPYRPLALVFGLAACTKQGRVAVLLHSWGYPGYWGDEDVDDYAIAVVPFG